MLIRTFGLLAGFILAGALAASAQSADDAIGTWRHPDNGSHVQMYKCGSGLCAKIVKITDGQKTDDKNPDAKKRSRPIIGLVIMSDAKPAGSGQWTGNLYNRSNGGTYSGTITVKSKNVIALKGCSKSIGFLCSTVEWSRVK